MKEIRRRLRAVSGMTLTEMLASLLILAMTAVAVGGGVMTVKKTWQSTVGQADADQILETTTELLTAKLSEVSEVSKDGENLLFLTDRDGGYIGFSYDAENGIYKFPAGQKETGKTPLLSKAAMANRFYTAFESISVEGACLVVKNIAVYERSNEANQVSEAVKGNMEGNGATVAGEANTVTTETGAVKSQKTNPICSLAELKVRAVNLEE